MYMYMHVYMCTILEYIYYNMHNIIHVHVCEYCIALCCPSGLSLCMSLSNVGMPYLRALSMPPPGADYPRDTA